MTNNSLVRDVIWDDIHVDKNTWEIITPLDLPGLTWVFSDEEIEDIIKMYVTLPEDENQALELLNEIFFEAVKYLKEELLYDDKEFWSVLKTEFTNLKSFHEFLRSTKNKKWKIKCTIIKHMLSIYDSVWKYNPRINEITEKTSRVIDNKLKKWAIQIISESDDWDFLRWVVHLHWKSVFFNMKRRLKSERSRVMKEMNDPNYHSVERLGDNYGVTFEMDNPEDIPMFANYIAKKAFKKWIYEIKLRTSILKEEIETNPNLSEEFREKWLKAKNAKKPETPEGLDDVRVVTSMYKDDETNNMSAEFRFIARKNKNENGLVMHDIMWYFKKLKSRIRAESFISPEYIERVIKNLLKDLPSLLEKNKLREDKNLKAYKKELFKDLRENGFISSRHRLNSSQTRANFDALLMDGLIGYYKSLLTPIKINSVWKTKYTLKRNVKISDELWLYFDFLKEEEA